MTDGVNRIRPRMISVAYRMLLCVADAEIESLEPQGDQS
jgi:hypothetical protein